MPHDVDTLLCENKKLRKQLEFFKQHHQFCSIVIPDSPLADDVSGYEDSDPGTGLQIIPFSFDDVEPSRLHNKIPKWRPIADQILKDVLNPEQWNKRRENLGLDTTQGTAWLITSILGAPMQVSRQQETSQRAAGVMVAAQAYANNTKATQELTDIFDQIQRFMWLVLVSLCAVLESLDFPLQEINETMRICLSDSEDINLKRLRRGALWVNSTIADMYAAGCGDQGMELFFSCAYIRGELLLMDAYL